MDDLISRQAVKEWLERWEGYLDKDMIARMQLKVDDIPTQKTPSNTLGALDCVERQAAIDMLNRGLSKIPYVNNTDTEMIRRDERMCCIQEIRELPSVQPREGKWTYRNGKPATIGKSYSVICSECKEWSEYCTNFCPNCGADMRGDKK